MMIIIGGFMIGWIIGTGLFDITLLEGHWDSMIIRYDLWLISN